MQRNWVHRIPNRRYARVLPDIALNEGTGNFKAQLLEESQPMAPRAFSKMDWSVVQAYPRFFWLMVIDVLATCVALRIGPSLQPVLQQIKDNLRAKRYT